MKYSIRSQKDVAAGVLYILFGAGFALGALNYRVGDAARMGPGWFPFAIGVLMVVVGLFTVFAGVRASTPEDKIQKLKFGALAWITAAVILFGLMLPLLGLVVSLVALVIVSSLASHEFTWKGAIATAVVLVLFSTAVFIWGINLQIPLWPSFVR